VTPGTVEAEVGRQMTKDAELAPLGAIAGMDTRSTAHERVRGWLRDRILTGDLPAGTRLVQADLASTLSVSTTPVRDALRDLVADGLVRSDHRGGIVEDLTPENLEDIIEIRAALEPIAMRRAVRNADVALILRLRFLHESMLATETTTQWVILNRQFHQIIAQASGSPKLASILGQLGDMYTTYTNRKLEFDRPRERAAREHAEIIQAFEARDEERAIAIMLKHIRNVSLGPDDE
jgi:DNA-binding GntR family transcriptional regulator